MKNSRPLLCSHLSSSTLTFYSMIFFGGTRNTLFQIRKTQKKILKRGWSNYTRWRRTHKNIKNQKKQTLLHDSNDMDRWVRANWIFHRQWRENGQKENFTHESEWINLLLCKSTHGRNVVWWERHRPNQEEEEEKNTIFARSGMMMNRKTFTSDNFKHRDHNLIHNIVVVLSSPSFFHSFVHNFRMRPKVYIFDFMAIFRYSFKCHSHFDHNIYVYIKNILVITEVYCRLRLLYHKSNVIHIENKLRSVCEVHTYHWLSFAPIVHSS